MSNEANEIKPSHVAAARLKMAIAKREGRVVAPWIRELAARDLAKPAIPRDQDDRSTGHPGASKARQTHLAQEHERGGDVEGARAAYQLAIDSGDAETAAVAASNLGYLLHVQGDVEGAQAAYQQAIDSGHPQYAPLAAKNLGHMLQQRGDMAGAQVAYQQAIDSGHPEYAPLAAMDLKGLLQERGDMEGARAAYQQAIRSTQTDLVQQT